MSFWVFNINCNTGSNDTTSANRYIPYLSCLGLFDLSYWIDYYWDNYVIRYIEWFLWNYIQKYIGLTFCDYESSQLSTTECWAYAWIFRPLYELAITFTVCSFFLNIFLGWMVIKDYMEVSGLYKGIVDEVAKNNE